MATDVGDEERGRPHGVRFGISLAIIDKRRIGNTGRTEAMHVIGEVEGKNVLILDDEIDTAGTIVAAVDALRANGCGEVIVSGYHPVLSGPARERLESINVREIVVTDTLPVGPEKRLSNMTVIPMAAQFGDVIGRIHSGQSVGALFQ